MLDTEVAPVDEERPDVVTLHRTTRGLPIEADEVAEAPAADGRNAHQEE